MIDKKLVRELVEMCRGDAKKVMKNGRWSIQLVPNDTHRVHFFGNENSAVEAEQVTAIHNHDKGFSSLIVFGRLQNIYTRVKPDPDGTLGVFDAIHNPQNKSEVAMVRAKHRVSVAHEATITYQAGDVYDMRAETYHRARVIEPAITLVDVWPQDLRVASAVLPYDTVEETFTRNILAGEELDAVWARMDALMVLAGV